MCVHIEINLRGNLESVTNLRVFAILVDSRSTTLFVSCLATARIIRFRRVRSKSTAISIPAKRLASGSFSARSFSSLGGSSPNFFHEIDGKLPVDGKTGMLDCLHPNVPRGVRDSFRSYSRFKFRSGKKIERDQRHVIC